MITILHSQIDLIGFLSVREPVLLHQVLTRYQTTITSLLIDSGFVVEKLKQFFNAGSMIVPAGILGNEG
ncbi:MAG: hypothetical protein AAF843_04150 [Bacteroidota bacterium]